MPVNQGVDQVAAKAPTGIEVFDEISLGELPRNRTTLVTGGPGAGKSVFALQTLDDTARKRKQAGTREFESDSQQAETSRRRAPGKPGVAATRAGAANSLLAALPAKDFARLESGLEPVTISCGEVLCEPGERMRHVYFPDNCVVSLLTLVEGHRALEVGLVGREGMIGARLALGATKSSVRALVQGAGTALRMNSPRFLRELRRSQTLQRALLRFTDTLMVQISQTAVCNRFHMLDARLARWLLITVERMRSSTFHLTHGFIADMLGVRREGVTVAAIELQRRGIIRYRRGDITILDLQGLEAACCSCYQRLRLMGSESS